jgi:quinohemoprotein amine dehydrogenase alpha subunit-like protein
MSPTRHPRIVGLVLLLLVAAGCDYVERASVDTAGGDPNGPSDALCGRPSITGDGNVVAFCSFASDLVTGDGNGNGADVFVRDLQNPTTTLISGATSGGSGPSISDDGRHVAYQTTQVFVHDRQTGTTAMASAKFGQAGNGISGDASISADGRYVSFHTLATNLVSDDGNGTFDVYVRAVLMPTVDSVTPDTVAPGTSATLTVTGSGFLPQANASASLFTPPGVTVDSVTVTSETELEVSVSVDPDAPSGGRLVLVWNPGTGPGSGAATFGLCGGCLTVT